MLHTHRLGNVCSDTIPPFLQVCAASLIFLLRSGEGHRGFLVHGILPSRWHKLCCRQDSVPVVAAMLSVSPHFSNTPISSVSYEHRC